MPDSPSSRRSSIVSRSIFDVPQKKTEIARLEGEMADPGFWDQPDKARSQESKISEMRADIDEHIARVEISEDEQARCLLVEPVLPNKGRHGFGYEAVKVVVPEQRRSNSMLMTRESEGSDGCVLEWVRDRTGKTR